MQLTHAALCTLHSVAFFPSLKNIERKLIHHFYYDRK